MKYRITGNEREYNFFQYIGINPDADSNPDEWYWTIDGKYLLCICQLYSMTNNEQLEFNIV